MDCFNGLEVRMLNGSKESSCSLSLMRFFVVWSRSSRYFAASRSNLICSGVFLVLPLLELGKVYNIPGA